MKYLTKYLTLFCIICTNAVFGYTYPICVKPSLAPYGNFASYWRGSSDFVGVSRDLNLATLAINFNRATGDDLSPAELLWVLLNPYHPTKGWGKYHIQRKLYRGQVTPYALHADGALRTLLPRGNYTGEEFLVITRNGVEIPIFSVTRGNVILAKQQSKLVEQNPTSTVGGTSAGSNTAANASNGNQTQNVVVKNYIMGGTATKENGKVKASPAAKIAAATGVINTGLNAADLILQIIRGKRSQKTVYIPKKEEVYQPDNRVDTPNITVVRPTNDWN